MSRKVSKEFREEAIRFHGNRCLNCGDDKRIEWHHIVPLEIGGNDIPSNTVPLCRSCHKAVTHHQLILSTVGRKYKSGGRKIETPDGYEEIFEDYVRCRIPKSVAAERLGKSIHFVELKVFENYLTENDIVKRKNNMDIILSQHGYIDDDVHLGFVEYSNGTVEHFYSGREQPKSGEYCGYRMFTRGTDFAGMYYIDSIKSIEDTTWAYSPKSK